MNTAPVPTANARCRNFDFLRLVAAGSVMLSHAFLIAAGGLLLLAPC